MASRWLREMCSDTDGIPNTNWNWWMKAVTLWLYRVMEFSLQSESCGSGKSWVSHEKTGVNGAFSGASFGFTDAIAASFVSSDRGKYIVIRDNANPKNGGVYRICQVSSATSIIIDFRAGTLEYPDVAAGLSWWICGPTYQTPQTNGDYVRLQSRHTSGWAVELTLENDNRYLTFRVATSGNWAAGPIIGNFPGLTPQPLVRTGMCGGTASTYLRMQYFAEGDYTNCAWLHFMQINSEAGATQRNSNATGLVEIAMVSPIEAGLPVDDLIILKGGSWNGQFMYADLGTRYYDQNYPAGAMGIGRGVTWNTSAGREEWGWSVDYSYSTYLTAFGRSHNKEPNRRRGNKLEAFWGEPYVIDPRNAKGQYRFLGFIQGHWMIPMLATGYNNQLSLESSGSNRANHKMAPVNMGGDRNRLVVVDGIVIPWCGLSIIGQGIPPV